MAAKQEAPHSTGKLHEPEKHQIVPEKQDPIDFMREVRLKTADDFENALKSLAQRFRSEKNRTPASNELFLKQVDELDSLAKTYASTLGDAASKNHFLIPEKIRQYRAVLKEIGTETDPIAIKTRLLWTGYTDVFSGWLIKKYPFAVELFGGAKWTKEEAVQALQTNPRLFSSMDFSAMPNLTHSEMFEMVKIAYDGLPSWEGIDMTNIPDKYFRNPVFVNSVIVLNARIFRWAWKKFERGELEHILRWSSDMSISRLYNLMKDPTLIRDRDFMFEACRNHPNLLQSMYGSGAQIDPGQNGYDKDQALFRNVLFSLDIPPAQLAKYLSPEAFVDTLLHKVKNGMPQAYVSSIGQSFNATNFSTSQMEDLRFRLYQFFTPEVFFRDLYGSSSMMCSRFNIDAITHMLQQFHRVNGAKERIGNMRFFPAEDTVRYEAVEISLKHGIPFGMEMLPPMMLREKPMVKRLLASPHFLDKKELQSVVRQMGKVDYSRFKQDVLAGKTDPALYDMEELLETPDGIMQITELLVERPQSFRTMAFSPKVQSHPYFPAILRGAVIADLSNYRYLPNVWWYRDSLFSTDELRGLMMASIRNPKSTYKFEDLLTIIPYANKPDLYSDGSLACAMVRKDFMQFQALPRDLQQNDMVLKELFVSFIRTSPAQVLGRVGCLIGVLSTLGQEKNMPLFKMAYETYIKGVGVAPEAREMLIHNEIFIRFVRNVGIDEKGNQIQNDDMKRCRDEIFAENLNGYFVVSEKQEEMRDAHADAESKRASVVEQLQKKGYGEIQSQLIANLVLSAPMTDDRFSAAFKPLLKQLGYDRTKNPDEINRLISDIGELQLAIHKEKVRAIGTGLAAQFERNPALHRFLLPVQPGKKEREIDGTAFEEAMSAAYKAVIERAESAKGGKLTEKERQALKQEAVRAFAETHGITDPSAIRAIADYFANKKIVADISKVIATKDTIALKGDVLTGKISQEEYETKSERLYAELERTGVLPREKTAFDAGKTETVRNPSPDSAGKPGEVDAYQKGITAPSFSELTKNHDKLPYDRPIKVEWSDVTVYRTDKDSFELCQSLNGDRTFRLKVPSSRIESATGSLAYLKELWISELGENAVTEMVRTIHESVPGIRIDFSQDLSHSDATMWRRVLLQSVAKLIGISHPEGYGEEDLVRTLRSRIQTGNGLIALLRNRSDTQPVRDPSGNVIPLVSWMTVSTQAIRLALKNQ